MFYIPIKLKPELAHASMMTSDVNNQWRSNFQKANNQTQIKFTTKNSIILNFGRYLNIIIRIECIFFVIL